MLTQHANYSFDEDAIAAGVGNEDVGVMSEGSASPGHQVLPSTVSFNCSSKWSSAALDSLDGLRRVGSEVDALLGTKEPRYIVSWFQVDREHTMSKVFG